MYLAKNVRAKDTTARLWKFIIKAKVSAMFLI